MIFLERPTPRQPIQLTSSAEVMVSKMALLNLQKSFDAEEVKGKCRKKLLCSGLLTLISVLYGVIILILVWRSFGSAPSPEDCKELEKYLDTKEIRQQLFGRWILHEAYSSDPIDRYALTHAKSSWAEFIREKNGTIYLLMSHMLYRPETSTIWCVYHHFRNMTLRNNTLYLQVPEHNASAEFRFLKACNECLVMTGKAFVPGYDPLDYLFAYGLHKDLSPYYLRRTREQADCLKLDPPPPFHYKGDDFCPPDEERPQRTSLDSFQHMFNILGLHPD
ncbi:uncharacterized protein ACJ7VT_003399 [Polymixia lowei]